MAGNLTKGLWAFLLLNKAQFYCKVLGLLRDRLMVGHIPLEDGILVRIQVPQHFGKLSASYGV